MSSLTVNTPDGKSLNVSIPDGSTGDQIHQAALDALDHYNAQKPAEPGIIAKAGKTALDILGIPNEMAGEAIRVAREGMPMRLPTALQSVPVNNQYLTNKGKPAEFVNEITSGLQGATRIPTALMQGQSPSQALQTASQEVTRPKNTGVDLINQLAFSAAAPEIAAAPFNAALKAAAPIARGVGNLAAQLSSAGTNVPIKDYKTLFNNPEAFLPGTMDKAKDVYAQAKETAGIPNEITVEQANVLKNPKKYVFDTFERIMNGENVTPKEALYARNGLDFIRPQPNAKNGSLMTVFDQMRDTFQGVVKATPSISAADQIYGPAKAASKFKSFVPLTSTGKPGFVRTGAMLSALGGPLISKSVPPGAAIAALGMSPIVAGGITAGAGAVAKAANYINQNPVLKNSIMAAFLAKRAQQ